MRTRHLLFATVMGLGLAGNLVSRLRAETPEPISPEIEKATRLAMGADLFQREWESIAFASHRSDGLGPLYNARSCATCHVQGGVGGGGGAEHNVDVLSVVPLPVEMPAEKVQKIRALAARVHPGFAGASNLVLHRHSNHEDYTEWREQLLKIGPRVKLPTFNEKTRKHVLLKRLKGSDLLEIGMLQLRLTQRNTPSIFGAGLIDQITETALREIASKQSRETSYISGRVAPGVGRFGWRGQAATLENFVIGACANELGLQTTTARQPQDPFRQPRVVSQPDLADDEVKAMTDYLRSLPPPKRLIASDRQEQARWEHGEAIFHAVHCAQCHVPQVQHVMGVYSDLLLHDMGPELSDPAPALSSSASAGYYGSVQWVSAGDPGQRLWRTPPLWGVRDTAPYLHDGRAATIEAAIEQHGGEALISIIGYERLSDADQRDLIDFVTSIGAP